MREETKVQPPKTDQTSGEIREKVLSRPNAAFRVRTFGISASTQTRINESLKTGRYGVVRKAS